MKYLIILSVFICGTCFAEPYIIVNPDNTIHTIEQKPTEKLQFGQKRFELSEWPAKYPDQYVWNKDHLEDNPNPPKRPTIADINMEKEIEIKMRLMAIDELEKEPNSKDYSKIKQRLLNEMGGL